MIHIIHYIAFLLSFTSVLIWNIIIIYQKSSVSSKKKEVKMSTPTTGDENINHHHRLVKTAHESSTFLTRSFLFKKFIREVFKDIDTDKSNNIDKDELYKGVLLIHLQLAMYAGPAACRVSVETLLKGQNLYFFFCTKIQFFLNVFFFFL